MARCVKRGNAAPLCVCVRACARVNEGVSEGESDKDKQKEIMICTCYDRFRSLIHSIFR